MKDFLLNVGWQFWMALGRLPLRWLWCIGSALGWCLYLFPTESKRVTRINIELCFPAWTAKARRSLVRQSQIESGRMLLEFGFLWGSNEQKILTTILEVKGEEHFQHALAQNKGVLIGVPHLGAWELAAVYCAKFEGLSGMYKPNPIGVVDRNIKAARMRAGMHLYPTDQSGIKALFKALRAGAPVSILPDQVPPKGTGMLADFFGQPAYCTKLYSRLAQASGARALLLMVRRDVASGGFRIEFKPLAEDFYSQEIACSLATLNQAIEQAIYVKPEQYLWNYKRFASRPGNLPKVYKKYT